MEPFRTDMAVRDYECDTQGMVNNAVYQNYLEHARHQVLEEMGLRFTEIRKFGIDLTLARAELHYRAPLVAGDKFTVSTKMFQRSPIRYVFDQEITTSEGRLILTAWMTVVTINDKGRPCKSAPFIQSVQPFLWEESQLNST